MAILYVNNFDNIRLIRQISTGAGPGSPLPVFKWVSGSVPVYDPPTILPPLVHSQVVEWGPMYEGASSTPSNGTFVTQPSGPLNPPTGVTVTLHNNGSTAGQSKTLYIVNPKDDLVRRGKVFTAELIFDMPMADNPPVPPSPAPAPGWSVALNFKTGCETDNNTTDVRIGVMCHFSGNGIVKFHGTDNPGAADSGKTYAQYGAFPTTQFCLTVELIIDQVAHPGTGSLRYGDQVLTGNLTYTPAPPAGFDFPDLTAVGVAVVTTTNVFNHFGARLRSFTLSGA
jgi:hypothetical protein